MRNQEKSRERFEIVKIDKKGNEITLNSEFTSYVDAIFAASFAGMSPQTEKVQIRSAQTKEWVWEMYYV